MCQSNVGNHFKIGQYQGIQIEILNHTLNKWPSEFF